MFDWKHYRYVAQELAERQPNDAPNQEAKLRSSISRAYYAAYCTARNGIPAINGMSKIPDGVESHTWVLKQYRERRDDTSKEIRQKLSSLKDRRVKVDYDNPRIELSECRDFSSETKSVRTVK
jgi:hypothetical protein